MYNTDGCQSICLYMKQLVFLIGILDSQIPSKGVVSIQNETKPMKGDESKKQKRLRERERERIWILGWLDFHSLTVWVSLVMGNWVSDSHRGASGRERERKRGEQRDEQSRTVKECKLKNTRSLSVNSFFEGSGTCLRVFSTNTGLH